MSSCIICGQGTARLCPHHHRQACAVLRKTAPAWVQPNMLTDSALMALFTKEKKE